MKSTKLFLNVCGKQAVLFVALACFMLVSSLPSVSAAQHAMHETAMSATAERDMINVDHGDRMDHAGVDAEERRLQTQPGDLTASSDCAMVSCCGHATDAMASFESFAVFLGLVHAGSDALRVTDRQPLSNDRPPKHL